MAAQHTRMEIVNESPKNSNNNIDPKVLEHIFGKPKSHNNTSDAHLLKMERNTSKPHQNGTPASDAERTSQPLLEPDREKQKPPLAGPEVDDVDDEAAAQTHDSFPGIDDGLLEPADKKPGIIDVDDEADTDQKDPHLGGEDEGTEDGKWSWHVDEPDFPYDNYGLSPRFGPDDRPVSPVPTFIDVNTYQQKKNLAQGMMDLALLSANANQLRYVLESASVHPYYYPSLVFISLSIIFQIAVGVGLIMNSRYDVNDKKEICQADKINNFTVLGIFLITIVNVFITSFSVATQTGAAGPIVTAQPAG